jgi:hypothetical protein
MKMSEDFFENRVKKPKTQQDKWDLQEKDTRIYSSAVSLEQFRREWNGSLF